MVPAHKRRTFVVAHVVSFIIVLTYIRKPTGKFIRRSVVGRCGRSLTLSSLTFPQPTIAAVKKTDNCNVCANINTLLQLDPQTHGRAVVIHCMSDTLEFLTTEKKNGRCQDHRVVIAFHRGSPDLQFAPDIIKEWLTDNDNIYRDLILFRPDAKSLMTSEYHFEQGSWRGGSELATTAKNFIMRESPSVTSCTVCYERREDVRSLSLTNCRHCGNATCKTCISKIACGLDGKVKIKRDSLNLYAEFKCPSCREDCHDYATKWDVTSEEDLVLAVRKEAGLENP